MSDVEKKLGESAIAVPEILLPVKPETETWATVACDQFTQDRPYWEKAAEIAGDRPSTLRMILPEAYLEDGDRAARIADIRANMKSCLQNGVFAEPRPGFVYLERNTPLNRKRRGLVVAVDLERYSWSRDARDMIRPTEGTVAERLPPRMEIRRGAPLESSHIIMLIDDDAESLLPKLGERAKKAAPLYSGDLMMNSGSVSGWLLDDADGWNELAESLAGLRERAAGRYLDGRPASAGERPFLFAVGDGNHSLASAKEIWEEYKAPFVARGETPPEHPCRYATVEIENIHDPAIKFEPIHRVVFGLDFDRAIDLLSGLPGFSCTAVPDGRELAGLVARPVSGNRFGVISRGGHGGHGGRHALVETDARGISTASLQPLLDRELGPASIDYIHGEAELFRLALSVERPATGILLPPVRKAGFFETVARTGPLPRKSFSMGESCEKRFYMECRRLFG